MIFTHEITLDVTINQIKTLNIKQYTKGSFKLHVTLTDRCEPFQADKNTHHCYFKMETPDKKHIFTDATINDDGSVDISIPEKACLAAGSGTAELVFKEQTEDTESIFATMNLNVNIIPSAYHNSNITSSDDFDALHHALFAADKTYDQVMTSAAASALLAQSYAKGDTNSREHEETDNAKYYKEEAKKAENAAANHSSNAKSAAKTANTKAGESADSATAAAASANAALNSKEEAARQANMSKSYAIGHTGLRENENEDCAKHYSEQAQYYCNLAQDVKDSLGSALRPMGTRTFANLPALADIEAGDMYNVSDQFTTNGNFEEGAGITVPAGSNVYKTAGGKWDILAGSPVTGIKGNAESSYRKGNVNITPANIGALPLSGGELSGELTPAGGVAYSGRNGYIAFPEDGYLNHTAGSVTGFLQISLPYTWCSSFLKFTVSIFNYETGQSVDYIIAGYNYQDGKRWERTTAICVGSARNEIANLPVNFGHDGANCAISIGTANTVWKCPGVQVHDISIFYRNTEYSRWRSGWKVSITTTPLKGGISFTYPNPNASYRCVAESVTDSNDPNNHALNLTFSLNKHSMDSANWLAAWDSLNRELRAIAPNNITGVGSAVKATQDSDGNVIKDTYLPASLLNGQSLSIGYAAYANANGSLAMPCQVRANGARSVALGWGSHTDGECSIAVGANTCAGSLNSVALGRDTYANGINSLALGNRVRTNGNAAMALGCQSNATGGNSTALGCYSGVSANNSTALGYYASTSNANSIQLGNASSLSSITSKVAITVTSDERDKADITTMEDGALEFLGKVTPIRYVFNGRELYIDEDNLSDEERSKKEKYGLCAYDRMEHGKGTKKGSRTRVGVSAQNVQHALKTIYGNESFANLVNNNLFDFDPNEIPEGVESQLAVNYEGFIPFLIKAVQELAEKIEQLQGKEDA